MIPANLKPQTEENELVLLLNRIILDLERQLRQPQRPEQLNKLSARLKALNSALRIVKRTRMRKLSQK